MAGADDVATLAPLFAVFTPEGLPGWIGVEPREGSEELPPTVMVDGQEIVADIPFLAAHMRTAKGEWVRRPPPPPPTEAEVAARVAAELEQLRGWALAQVDEMIEAARLRFVTSLPGQEAIYLAKEAEARVYVTEVPEPASLVEFPFLSAEVGITAPTALALAQLWLQRGALFRALGARTEHLRMATRKSIIAAKDREVLASHLKDLTGQLDQLG